jgi:hypothetical protein
VADDGAGQDVPGHLKAAAEIETGAAGRPFFHPMP